MVKTILEINQKQRAKIDEIFFESSARTNFESENEKEDFYFRYLGFYIKNYPEFFLVGLEGDNVLGYICASPDSLNEEELFKLLPHYHLFKEFYQEFPVHLHINMNKESRGKGLGSLLINTLEVKCRDAGLKGIHLITGKSERNVGFYLKNKYQKIASKNFKSASLLLMGKDLVR